MSISISLWSSSSSSFPPSPSPSLLSSLSVPNISVHVSVSHPVPLNDNVPPPSFLSLCFSPSLLKGPLSLLIPYLNTKDIIHFTSTNSNIYKELFTLTLPNNHYVPLSVIWKDWVSYSSSSLSSQTHSKYVFPRVVSLWIRDSLAMEIFTNIVKQLEEKSRYLLTSHEIETNHLTFSSPSLSLSPTSEWANKMNLVLNRSSPIFTESDAQNSIVIHFHDGHVIYLPIYRVFSFFRSIQNVRISFPPLRSPSLNIITKMMKCLESPFSLVCSLRSFDFHRGNKDPHVISPSELEDFIHRCSGREIKVVQFTSPHHQCFPLSIALLLLNDEHAHHPSQITYDPTISASRESIYESDEKRILFPLYLSTHRTNWHSITTLELRLQVICKIKEIDKEEKLMGKWFEYFDDYLVQSTALTSLSMDHLPSHQMENFLRALCHTEGRGKHLRVLSLLNLHVTPSQCGLLGKYFLFHRNLHSLTLNGTFPQDEKYENPHEMSIDQMLSTLIHQRVLSSLSIHFYNSVPEFSESDDPTTGNEFHFIIPFLFGHSLSLLVSHLSHSLKYLNMGMMENDSEYRCHPSLISLYSTLQHNRSLTDIRFPSILLYTDDAFHSLVDCFHHGEFHMKYWSWKYFIHLTNSSKSNSHFLAKYLSIVPINGNGNIDHIAYEIDGKLVGGMETIKSLILSADLTLQKEKTKGLFISPFSLSFFFDESKSNETLNHTDLLPYSDLLSSLSSSLSRLSSLTSLSLKSLTTLLHCSPAFISALLPSLLISPFCSLITLQIDIFVSSTTHCSQVESFFTQLADNKTVQNLSLILHPKVFGKVDHKDFGNGIYGEWTAFVSSYRGLDKTFYPMLRRHTMLKTLSVLTPFDLFSSDSKCDTDVSCFLFTSSSHPSLTDIQWTTQSVENEIRYRDLRTAKTAHRGYNPLLPMLSAFLVQNSQLRKLSLEHCDVVKTTCEKEFEYFLSVLDGIPSPQFHLTTLTIDNIYMHHDPLCIASTLPSICPTISHWLRVENCEVGQHCKKKFYSLCQRRGMEEFHLNKVSCTMDEMIR